jgi:uncharacterized membrane protein YraQ (UPF0718 family)
MLDKLGHWVDYLIANPIIGIAVVIVLVLFLVMVFTKLFKWAIIAFILLVVAIALTFRVSQPKAIIEKMHEGIESIKEGLGTTQKELQKGEKEVKKTLKKVEKDIKKID